MELLRGRQFEVAIADLVMPGMDGIQTIAALKEVDPDVEVIILTGHATVDSTIAALRQGACDFLQKPTGMAQLRPALGRALEKRRGELTRVEHRLRAVIETARKCFVDLSARQPAESALREGEDRYRDLVENSFVLIGTHDAKGRFLSLNRALARLLEVANAEEAVGRPLTDYVPPDLLPQFDEYLKTILREGTPRV